MPRCVWLTDLHFDFVADEQRRRLAEEVRDHGPEVLLVGGDIAVARTWAAELHWLESLVDGPVYFVLGNHDYYGSSIATVRQQALALTVGPSRLAWLPAAGAVKLSDATALVGHGGWGDGRAGRFARSKVILNDYLLIEELRRAARLPDGVSPQSPLDARDVLLPTLRRKLEQLGDESAAHLAGVLPRALEQCRQAVVLMHVPPFREACWHEGRTSDDNWAPHFCCLAAGEVLRAAMAAHPDRRMTVLCGHTHGEGRAEILPNLEVRTAPARYGYPRVQYALDL